MQASPASVGTLEAQNMRAILPHLPSDRFVRPCHCPSFRRIDRTVVRIFFMKSETLFPRLVLFFRLESACNVCERSRNGEYMSVKVSKIYKKTCERVQKPPHNLTFRKKNSIIGKTDCSTDCKSSRTAKQVARRPSRIFTLGEFSPTLFFRQRSRDRRVFGGD